MQDQLKLTAACAFGLEAIVKRELIALGYSPSISQPGRVNFAGIGPPSAAQTSGFERLTESLSKSKNLTLLTLTRYLRRLKNMTGVNSFLPTQLFRLSAGLDYHS